uniref:ETS-related transcription factor Elf-3-like n=1 Tax=Sinocyclocheilus rhinocerous TaxID=307959 RepID=A0A673N4L7_9TELE
MASSELSLILNNANANLYPSEPQPNLLSMTAPMGRLSEMTFSSNNSTMGPWDLVNPQMWTRQNVLEWIGFHVEDSRFDASLLNMNYCDMDGITLCTMSKETLMSMFGSMLGERLHHSLETQKARYGEQQRRNLFEEAFEVSVLECINTLDLFVLGPLLETVQIPLSTLMSTPTKNFVKQESGEPKKRGRGRPPKCQSEGFDHFIQSKKSKHAPRGTHLWEFIRDILIHPEKNQGLMKWEDRRDGVFKFLKSEAVAQLWGQETGY